VKKKGSAKSLRSPLREVGWVRGGRGAWGEGFKKIASLGEGLFPEKTLRASLKRETVVRVLGKGRKRSQGGKSLERDVS